MGKTCPKCGVDQIERIETTFSCGHKLIELFQRDAVTFTEKLGLRQKSAERTSTGRVMREAKTTVEGDTEKQYKWLRGEEGTHSIIQHVYVRGILFHTHDKMTGEEHFFCTHCGTEFQRGETICRKCDKRVVA